MTESIRLKISVLIASRGNSSGLRSSIGALDMLASGKHDIVYIVSNDFDDVLTQTIVGELLRDDISANIVCQKRVPSLGEAWNNAVSFAPADIYALISDRACPVTPIWDTILADAYMKDDTRVLWWTTNASPVLPIVTHKWLEAAGRLYTDYFPFWFDDTWLHEVSAMVHGLPNYMVQAQLFINKKKSPITKRLRDLRFWMDFFIAKRPERIVHAADIRTKLGLKMPDIKPIEAWFKSNDEMWNKKCAEWEKLMGDPSEPDESYFIAKKAAEDAIKNI